MHLDIFFQTAKMALLFCRISLIFFHPGVTPPKKGDQKWIWTSSTHPLSPPLGFFLGIGEPNKDAYNALKRALRQKIGKESDIDAVMKLLEENPISKPHRAMLQEEIATTKAHKDDELNQPAKALLKKPHEIFEGEEVQY
jgi:hypothetical protein